MIKELKQRVFDILEAYPYTREYDNQLLSIIWKSDMARIANYDLTTDNFFELLENGKLTNFESVRRIRQKLQEHHIKLRGKNYKKRQEELETQVREEIRELSFDERFGEKISVVKDGDLFRE